MIKQTLDSVKNPNNLIIMGCKRNSLVTGPNKKKAPYLHVQYLTDAFIQSA